MIEIFLGRQYPIAEVLSSFFISNLFQITYFSTSMNGCWFEIIPDRLNASSLIKNRFQSLLDMCCRTNRTWILIFYWMHLKMKSIKSGYLVMSEVLPTWLSPRNTNLNFVRIPIWALYKIKNCYRSLNTQNKIANPSLEPDKKFSNPGRLFRKYKLFREVNFYIFLSRTKSGNHRLGPDGGSRLI